jgi:hypothetical protein
MSKRAIKSFVVLLKIEIPAKSVNAAALFFISS